MMLYKIFCWESNLGIISIVQLLMRIHRRRFGLLSILILLCRIRYAYSMSSPHVLSPCTRAFHRSFDLCREEYSYKYPLCTLDQQPLPVSPMYAFKSSNRPWIRGIAPRKTTSSLPSPTLRTVSI